MSEAMKQFMEFMSKQDKEIAKKVTKMEQADVIRFALENGISLSDADFEPQDEE